jgi:mono/diheme cytochrome c family protein
MKIRLIYTASLTALAAGLLFACGNGDDDDTSTIVDTDSGTSDAATTPDAAPLDPTFTNVYATILGGVCAQCHGAATGDGALSGGLLMDTKQDAYSALVNVAAAGEACGTSGETRVVPSSSATSLLWQKVNGTQTCGGRMPLGGELEQAQIDLIAAWINAGAQDD